MFDGMNTYKTRKYLRKNCLKHTISLIMIMILQELELKLINTLKVSYTVSWKYDLLSGVFKLTGIIFVVSG